MQKSTFIRTIGVYPAAVQESSLLFPTHVHALFLGYVFFVILKLEVLFDGIRGDCGRDEGLVIVIFDSRMRK